MKTLKTLAIASLLVLSVSAFAKEKNKERATMHDALNTYINAVSYGQTNALTDILDNDVKFTLAGGDRVSHLNKSGIVTSLKNFNGLQQNCQTEYSIIDLNSTQAVVKVTMKYDTFSKVNLVSLANSSDGWKITNVSSSFH